MLQQYHPDSDIVTRNKFIGACALFPQPCKCDTRPTQTLYAISRACTVVYGPRRTRGRGADAKETGRETDFDVERKDSVVEVDGA